MHEANIGLAGVYKEKIAIYFGGQHPKKKSVFENLKSKMKVCFRDIFVLNLIEKNLKKSRSKIKT